MLRVALRSVLARKLRLLLTSIAIVLGVAFVSGAFVLTDSLRGSFDTIFEEASEGLDLQVQGREHRELTQNPQTASSVDLARLGIPPSVLETVRGVDGVARAEGTIFELGAQPLDKDGEPFGQIGPPRFATSWVEGAEDLLVIDIVEGEAPGPTEVMLDEYTATEAGFEIGDEITLLIQGGRKVETFTLSGITRFGEIASLNGASISSFETATVQRLLDMGDRYSTIEIQAEPGVDVQALQERVRAALPDGYDASTAAEFVEQQTQAIDDQFLGLMENVLLGFAAVAVFVGAFTIFNTFTIIVGQRAQEFGLLRTLGAARIQVLAVVIVEAIVVGIVASIIGIFAGFGVAAGLRWLLGKVGGELPAAEYALAPSSMAWAFAVGVGVTLVAAIVPAVRASRLSPLEAMRGTTSRERVGWGWPLIGALIATAGVGAVAYAMFGEPDSTMQAVGLVGGGCALVLVGAAIFSRALVGPVSRALRPLVGWGVIGAIALGNVLRTRVRAATTASALMIGLALASLALVFYGSLLKTFDAELDRTLGSDISIVAEQGGAISPTLPDEALDIAGQVDGVEQLASQRITNVVVGDTYSADAEDSGYALAADEGMIGDDGLVTVVPVAGTLQTGRGEVATSESYAEEFDLAVGSSVELAFPTGEARVFEVVGTYASTPLLGDGWLIDLDEFNELAPAPRKAPSAAFIRVEDGFDAADVADDIEQELEGTADFLNVQDTQELRDEVYESLQPVLGGVLGMLSLSLVVALFGIGNAMALNVFERTREIGLLRAVGSTRRQIRRIVRRESVFVALYGAIAGTLIGVGAGALIIEQFDEDGWVFAVDGFWLAVILLVGIIAGVLAAVLPARRAARTDVLAAISHE